MRQLFLTSDIFLSPVFQALQVPLYLNGQLGHVKVSFCTSLFIADQCRTAIYFLILSFISKDII